MKIEFQYLAKGASKPDNVTLIDSGYTVESGEPIPNIGDCISAEICFPLEKKGFVGHFKVVARHFFYHGNSQNRHMIMIVEDVEDLPQNNFRE